MEEKDDDGASLLGSRRYSSLEEKEDPRRPHIEAEAKEVGSYSSLEEKEDPRRQHIEAEAEEVGSYSSFENKEYDPRRLRIEAKAEETEAEETEAKETEAKETEAKAEESKETEAKETEAKAEESKETYELFLRRSGRIFAHFMFHHNTTSLAEMNKYDTTPQKRMKGLVQAGYNYYIEKGIPIDKLDEFLVAFIYTYISLTHLHKTSTGQMVAQYFGRFKPGANIGEFTPLKI